MPATKPVLIIVNPISGASHDQWFLSELERHLGLRGFPVEVRATRGPGDARRLARAVDDGARCVVSIGGDGTHREVASGLIGRPVPVCIVPSGTENVLGRTLAVRSTLADTVSRVQDGQTLALDLGMAGDHPFIMFAGVGFDAAVTRMVHENRSGNIQRSAYYGPIFRLWWRCRMSRLSVKVDGRTVTDDAGFLLVANTPRYINRLAIAPMAVGDDGLLDVVCYRIRSRWQLLAMALETMRRRHLEHPMVLHRRGRCIEVTSNDSDQLVETDGDAVTATPVTFTVMPRAVNFLVAPRAAP
jgi:YegS/Rv2252/BmrU family lipid kinase